MSYDCMYRSGGSVMSNVLEALSCISTEEQLLSSALSALHVTVHVPASSVVRFALESTNDSGGSLKQDERFTKLCPLRVKVHVTRPNLSDAEGFLNVYEANVGVEV